MHTNTVSWIDDEVAALREAGLYTTIRTIDSPMDAWVTIDGRRLLNFCANNYLGLADHPDIIAAAKQALDTHGFGMASVRFICGTQDLHKQLEKTIAEQAMRLHLIEGKDGWD